MTKQNIKVLDRLWQQTIVAQDGKCLKCGKREALSAHHIYSRKNRSTRWDTDNGVALCVAHHIFWAHKNPTAFTYWLEGIKGRKFLKALQRKADKIVKNQSYEKIKAQLEEELTKYENIFSKHN